MGLAISIILMIGFLIFSYLINSKDIVSPSIIIFSVFIISALFNVINYNQWNVSIGITYIAVIMIGFTATLIGERFGKYFGKKLVFVKSKVLLYFVHL